MVVDERERAAPAPGQADGQAARTSGGGTSCRDAGSRACADRADRCPGARTRSRGTFQHRPSAAGSLAPRPAGVPSGASGADRYRSGLEIFRAGDLDGAAAIWETLLAEEHRGAFTLQLLTACQHDTIKEAQRSLAPQELYLVAKKVDGRVCYRICLGAFDSQEAAGRALAGLPGEYRTAGAKVRAVADVLDRNR